MGAYGFAKDADNQFAMALKQPFLEAFLFERACFRDVLTKLGSELDHAAERERGSLDIPRVRSLLERLHRVDIPQHVREDQRLFPRIRERCPPLGPVLVRIAEEHARLEPMCGELVAALDRETSQENPDHAGLAEQVRRLVDILLGQLGVEENYILPVAADFLTPQDWAEVESVTAARHH